MLKAQIRSIMLKKRLSYTDLEKSSIAIKQQLFSHFDFAAFNLVHVYLPMSQKNEINTFPIIREIRSKYTSVKIISPIVDFNSSQLIHAIYHPQTVLTTNKYGIPEPPLQDIFTDLASIDAILIPLLAYDKKGNRVGYGKGYYDKFLIKCPTALKIGLSTESPLESIADIHDGDVRLDYCVTNNKTYSFAADNFSNYQ